MTNVLFVSRRRYSRSPRRDRRRDRYSRSRSRSRDRRTDKNDVKSDKNNADKPNAGTRKTTMTITGKKLPFIGRMPVFKKQTGKSENLFSSNSNQGVAIKLNINIL